jgi:hypothetical protein
MNRKLQRILQQVALCASVGLALGVATDSACASTSGDMSADGGSADGWQDLAVVGDQQAAPSPAAAKAGQKSDIQDDSAPKSATSPSAIESPGPTRASVASYGAVDQGVATVTVAPGVSTPQAEVKPVWHVETADGTFQKLFGRWAATAGWTSRWDVPQDIPVIGEYTFEGSFTDAVFSVTDSTDGTDMPVHPCFYTNNLVRIVPVSVVCNPANN